MNEKEIQHAGKILKWKHSTELSLTLRLLMSYIYIYDISSLKVNNLTLIPLTWRNW